MTQKADLKIYQYSESTIKFQIQNQLRSSRYIEKYSFFECDGDEFMFYKTFKRDRSKGGLYDTKSVFKIYLIEYDIFNSNNDIDSIFNPPFRFKKII